MRQSCLVWGFLALGCATGLATRGEAQNLLNGDFEKPLSGGSVPDWGWNWGQTGTVTTTLLTKASEPQNVFCGEQSLKLTVPASGYYEFGKTWPTSTTNGMVVTARVRLRLSAASLSQNVKLVAYAFNPTPPQPPWFYGTKNETLPAATTDWQELTIGHTVNTNRPYQLRIGLEMNGITTADHVILDYVVFGSVYGASSPGLNANKFPDYEVASPELSLLLDGATGDIAHLRYRDPSTGVLGDDHLHPTTATPLYTVRSANKPTMTTGAGTPPTAIALVPGGIKVARDQAGDPLKVEVDITAGSTTEEITLLPAITYLDTTTKVKEVEIAPLRLTRTLGTSYGDDLYFLPAGDGSVSSVDAFLADASLGSSMSLSREYPGPASMQFLAFFDDTQGITLSSRDTQGESKKLVLDFQRNSGTAPQLLIQHQTPETAGAAIESFPIRIERCSGSWMEAAAKYRDWALAQSWAGTDPAYPDPSWVSQRPVLFDADMQPQQIGLPLVSLDPITLWGDVLDAWKADFGGPDFPMMPLHRGFEHYGTFITPFILPFSVRGTSWNAATLEYNELYGASRIAAVWSDIASSGHVPMTMVTGLKWAQSRAQHPSAGLCAGQFDKAWWVQAFDASHNGWNGSASHPPADDVCATLPNGSLLIVPPGAQWDSTHARMCPSHQTTVDDYVLMAQEAASAGSGLFQLDQNNGGHTPPCYNTAHGHPAGYGRWRYLAVRDFFTAILDAGRAIDPDFSLALEDPNELWIPYLAVSGVRAANLHGWPAGDPIAGAIQPPLVNTAQTVVPAFEFVYGSVEATCTWDVGFYAAAGAGPSHANNTTFPDQPRWDMVRQGLVLVSGVWLSAQIHPWTLMAEAQWPACGLASYPDVLPDPDHADPIVRQFLGRAARLVHGAAKAYLNDGVMVRAEGHQVPQLSIDDHPEFGDFDHDAILLSAWRLDAQNFGLLLANVDYSASVNPVVVLPTVLDGQTIPLSGTTATVYDGDTVGPAVPYSSLQLSFTVPANRPMFIKLVLP